MPSERRRRRIRKREGSAVISIGKKRKKGKTSVKLDHYRKLFSYNEKVLNSYFEALANLPWATISKNMEVSHNSMKNSIVHILTVYNGWLNYNVYGKSSEIPHDTEHNPDNYHSMEDIGKFKTKVFNGVGKLLDSLDDDAVFSNRKVRAPWLPGSHSLENVLMQVSLEQAHHIGEIIAMLWQLDIEPPEMTWIMNTSKK